MAFNLDLSFTELTNDSNICLTPRTPRPSVTPVSSPSRISIEASTATSFHTTQNIHTIAQNTLVNSSTALSLDEQAIAINKNDLHSDMKSHYNKYASRYPFLKSILSEIESFNAHSEQFLLADKLLHNSHCREILGLEKNTRHAFGNGQAMLRIKNIMQASSQASHTFEETSLSTFTHILKTLPQQQAAQVFRVLDSLAASKNTVHPFQSFENYVSNAFKSNSSGEMLAFESLLNKFNTANNRKFSSEDALVDEAYKEYLEDRRLALQALIHILKGICSKEAKHSSHNIQINEPLSALALSLLEQVRAIYEDEMNAPIPFDSIGQLLENLFSNEKGRSSSAPNSRETTPRIPSALSSPEISTERPRSPSYPPRRSSPVMRRRSRDARTRNVNSEKSTAETVQKMAQQIYKTQIPPLPLMSNLPTSSPHSSEESSPKTPSPKVTFEGDHAKTNNRASFEALRDGLKTERCFFHLSKQGDLVFCHGKLDAKSVKLVLKKIDNMIDSSLPVPEFHQMISQIDSYLYKMLEHKSFKAVFHDNPDIYDYYLIVHVKVKYGGCIYTFEQFYNHGPEFLKLLESKNIPKDFSVDLYGTEVEIYPWFSPKSRFPSVWFTGLDVLKAPAEKFRSKIRELESELARLNQVFEKHLFEAEGLHLLREEYPSQSKKQLRNHDFITTLFRDLGKEKFTSLDNPICTDKTLLQLVEKIFVLENKINYLTSHQHFPSIDLVFQEFETAINELKSQNNSNIKVVKDLATHLLLESDDPRLEIYIQRLLEHPYVHVEAILKELINN